jgi:FemAB-related protein (PEP-CTERM system-associated)
MQTILKPLPPPAEPVVGPLDDGAAADWDAFVRATPGASFCHLWGWRRVMAQTLGLDSVYLGARGPDGALAGVLPLVRIRSLLFGHQLVSMPYLNEGGPIGSAWARKALLERAVAESRDSGATLLELRTRGLPPAVAGIGPARSKITVLMDMPETAELLWSKGLPSKLRSQIRRPQKEGLEARFGPELRHDFYHVFARNLRDLGTPVHPRGFFDAIARELGEHVVFAVVYKGGGDEPVAAGCGFVWKGEIEITWAGSLREHKRIAPNMLLYWAFMEEGIRRGARVFNFGRCAPGGGTHRFKQQWGGRDVELPWVQWPDGDAAPPSADSAAFRLATAAWKRLPVGVANRLGPALARRIATY